MRARIAIVTGAALGIGRATAIRLAADGAHVVACDVNEDGLAATAAAIAGAGGAVSAMRADVSKQADVDAVVGEATGNGPVTILANVAGVADYFLPVGELDDETWDRIIAINLTGCMRFARAVVPLMEDAGAGSITNIGSVAALGGGGGGTAYTAAKHGLIGLTKSIAFLYGPRGIRCNAVCPGGVSTTIAETSGYPKVEWAGERLMASFALSQRLGGARGDRRAHLVPLLRGGRQPERRGHRLRRRLVGGVGRSDHDPTGVNTPRIARSADAGWLLVGGRESVDDRDGLLGAVVDAEPRLGLELRRNLLLKQHAVTLVVGLEDLRRQCVATPVPGTPFVVDLDPHGRVPPGSGVVEMKVTHRVVAHDLLPLVVGDLGELLVDHLARVRPVALHVREVGRPLDAVDADVVADLQPEAVDLEAPVEVVPDVPARRVREVEARPELVRARSSRRRPP